MDTIVTETEARRTSAEIEAEMSPRTSAPRPSKPSVKVWASSLITLGTVAAGIIVGPQLLGPHAPVPEAAAPPGVFVSAPLQQEVDGRLEILGQFSAVQRVELRPQVGGTLTQIGFKDGDIVRKGDLLFEIDQTPYQIKLSEAQAQVENARARLDLAYRETFRATSLARTGAGSVETADQRVSQQRVAQAALDEGLAAVRDAQFDLDHTRITAPFTGRIGTHLVSVGNLISGSRAGTSPTTLLATIVSTDTIYLNFDMSEADYMTFLRERLKQGGPLADKVQISLSDERRFSREGILDFIDNSLDRASGTIHARATIPDADGLLTPGGFARVRVQISPPMPALLVPDAAVLADQSDHFVLTVDTNNVVTPKHVQIGDLRDGLRVIRGGLSQSDHVVVNGIPVVRPGETVAPHIQKIQTASN